MIESTGVALLGVHGRYREQRGPDTGLASWEHIKAVKEAVAIPVFANGNIQSKDDVIRCLEYTSCEGVMSAEGILHNPAIFSGKPLTLWDATDEYLQLARQHPPPFFSFVRAHIFKILHHCLTMNEHADLRQVVSKTRLLESFLEVALKLKELYKTEYEQYMAEHADDDETFQPHPDTLPIFFCKPYYRPPPTKFNSKNVDKSDAEDDEPKPVQRQVSKRQLKRMEKSDPNKKLCIGNIVEDIIPRYVPKRVFEICTQVQCPNPRGAKCDFDFCKKCCRIKTKEDVLDCKGTSFQLVSLID